LTAISTVFPTLDVLADLQTRRGPTAQTSNADITSSAALMVPPRNLTTSAPAAPKMLVPPMTAKADTRTISAGLPNRERKIKRFAARYFNKKATPIHQQIAKSHEEEPE
jgi:hypothetical protein